MAHSVEDLQRIGVKFFLAGDAPDPSAVVAAFHRWIRAQSVEGLLIDVGDYAHVPEGPGVILVAHEGTYALDLGGGRPGVLYYRKQPLNGDLEQRLSSVASAALRAAQLLAADGELGSAAGIAGDALQVFANDRLLAPNDAATEAAFAPSFDRFLDKLFDGSPRQIRRDADPKVRFNMEVEAERGADAETLLRRLA